MNQKHSSPKRLPIRAGRAMKALWLASLAFAILALVVMLLVPPAKAETNIQDGEDWSFQTVRTFTTAPASAQVELKCMKDNNNDGILESCSASEVFDGFTTHSACDQLNAQFSCDILYGTTTELRLVWRNTSSMHVAGNWTWKWQWRDTLNSTLATDFEAIRITNDLRTVIRASENRTGDNITLMGDSLGQICDGTNRCIFNHISTPATDNSLRLLFIMVLMAGLVWAAVAGPSPPWQVLSILGSVALLLVLLQTPNMLGSVPAWEALLVGPPIIILMATVSLWRTLQFNKPVEDDYV